MRAGQKAAVKAAGVLVYVMRGYVGTDTWDRPATLAKFGETPDQIT